MLLLMSMCAVWTTVQAWSKWGRGRVGYACMRNIEAYDKQSRQRAATDTTDIDFVPISADAYCIRYALKSDHYMACSSVLVWPITCNTSLTSILLRPYIINATLILEGDHHINVTSLLRQLAGVHGNFHIRHNALTWRDVFFFACKLSVPDKASLCVTFFRLQLSAPYVRCISTLQCSVDDAIARAKPYVL